VTNAHPGVVFFLDVDNTLLDNDGLKADLARQLTDMLGSERSERFWEMYEQVRKDEDYVDYPTTVQRFSAEDGEAGLQDRLTRLLYDYPFRDRLYPHVFETLEHLAQFGVTVLLSDGDPVYQPLKIQRSGLAAAVDGRVMICVHKEAELPRVFATYPADHYVMIDDKPRIHAALERCCSTEFTTILVKQGKYATDDTVRPRPDLTADSIGDLRFWPEEKLLAEMPRQTRSPVS
jgi:FMN phosphatase YigB (HAD superfamily)